MIAVATILLYLYVVLSRSTSLDCIFLTSRSESHIVIFYMKLQNTFYHCRDLRNGFNRLQSHELEKRLDVVDLSVIVSYCIILVYILMFSCSSFSCKTSLPITFIYFVRPWFFLRLKDRHRSTVRSPRDCRND